MYAHLKNMGLLPSDRQMMRDHLTNVSEYASVILAPFRLAHVGQYLGLVHDFGKYKKTFQEYMSDAAAGKQVKRGDVVHAKAGMAFTHKICDHSDPKQEMAAQILGYVIGAHHGLYDCIEEDGKSRHAGYLDADYLKEQDSYEECLQNFSKDFNIADMQALFVQASEEISDFFVNRIKPTAGKSYRDILLFISFLERLLLSALVDADRRDTAEFMNNTKIPLYIEAKPGYYKDRISALMDRLDSFSHEGALNQAKAEISNICAETGRTSGTGTFRLDTPTGSGKTYSSARFALENAKHNSLPRIIFTAPMISIINQNSEDLKDALDAADSMLIQHSGYIAEEGEEGRYAGLAETWDVPLIYTTLARIMSIMYNGRLSYIRQFHALCRSILVVDEVQAVPLENLGLWNQMVRFLSLCCGSSVVLCSATQPAPDLAKHPIPAEEIKSIIGSPKKYYDLFRRADIKDGGTVKESGMPVYVMDKLKDVHNILVVCNTIKEVDSLYNALKDNAEGIEIRNITGDYCTAQRSDIMDEIGKLLEASGKPEGKKLVVIATPVIEAGVNLSFEAAIRYCAGIENAVQLAGRVNRYGELTSGALYIVRITDEKLSAPMQEVANERDLTADMIYLYKENPQDFDSALDSGKAVRWFYGEKYRRLAKGSDEGAFDGLNTVYELLSTNSSRKNKCGIRDYEIASRAQKTAGEIFTVYGEDSTQVIVPYKEGKDIIAGLSSERAKTDFLYVKELLRKASLYTVSMYKQKLDKALETGDVVIIETSGGSIYIRRETDDYLSA